MVCFCVRVAHIAPLVALSDLIAMIGSGMTVKFFALFFWKDLGLRPIMVSAVFVAGPIGIAAFAQLAQRTSTCIGRVQTTLCAEGCGVSLLVALAFLHRKEAVLPVYLLRTWLMNCCTGLNKSVLNDYVPKRNRAKWNSLESLNFFSWSGSALLGGVLVDQFGYRFTFLVTAALQSLSLCCLVPLALLVHAEPAPGDKVAPAASDV